MKIRESTNKDKKQIQNLHINAFGNTKGIEIADLAIGLMDDETALPMTSLVAVDGSDIIGHIIYTNVSLLGSEIPISAQILAPLAVDPNAQKQGVGAKLIEEGLKRLKQNGVQLVFVLGHPSYYPRSGFIPAGKLGFEAPYYIPEEHADAWMVMALDDRLLGKVSGKVKCSRVLNQPEHWRE